MVISDARIYLPYPECKEDSKSKGDDISNQLEFVTKIEKRTCADKVGGQRR